MGTMSSKKSSSQATGSGTWLRSDWYFMMNQGEGRVTAPNTPGPFNGPEEGCVVTHRFVLRTPLRSMLSLDSRRLFAFISCIVGARHQLVTIH
jgi:hypothetical protein